MGVQVVFVARFRQNSEGAFLRIPKACWGAFDRDAEYEVRVSKRVQPRV